MNPVYTREQLESKSRQQLWEICDRRSLPRRRSSQNCIQQILDSQPQKVAEAEVVQAQTTCETCPLARHIDGDRYCCQSAHNQHNQVTRGHWEATQDCEEAIADYEAAATDIKPLETWQYTAKVALVDFLLSSPTTAEPTRKLKPIRSQKELEENLDPALAAKFLGLVDNAKYDASDISRVRIDGDYVYIDSWLENEPIIFSAITFSNRINQYLGLEPVPFSTWRWGDRKPQPQLTDKELWQVLGGITPSHTTSTCRDAMKRYSNYAAKKIAQLNEQDDRGSGRVLVEA